MTIFASEWSKERAARIHVVPENRDYIDYEGTMASL